MTVRFADKTIDAWTSSDELLARRNMAASMNVDLERVRVQQVRNGSVILDIVVDGYATLSLASAAQTLANSGAITFDPSLGSATVSASTPTETRE